MSQALEDYLDHVMIYANRTADEATAIRAELQDHLETKIESLQAQGLNREDAVFRAIKDHGPPRIVGYGLRPRFPWLDVRTRGTARGFVAIGQKAVGVFAFGGAAVGVFSFGGFSAGVFSLGGFSAALLLAWGGFAFAPLGLAFGGFAAGLLACGGLAVGIVALGGTTLGLWAMGAKALSAYPTDPLPAVVRPLMQVMHDISANGWFTGIVMLVFGVFLTLGLVLQAREKRRLNRSDPWLAE